MHGISELWVEFKQTGNVKHFSGIYEKFWERLLSVSYSILRDQKEAEDIVQEVFVSLWRKQDKYSIDNIEAYLYQAVKLAVFLRLRRLKVADEHLKKMDSIKFANNIEEKLSYEEAKNTLDDCIANLPEKAKKVFILSRYENRSNEQIALQLGISEKTVEGHITSALKKLRKCHSERE
ncbi:RNA polymerase sigma-70 factor [Algoriphagus sp. D3-2-R+10]|uniref:RNA polymerase sigma-70 factor n=1 Tax=Algoriphagus aurantiacus TaxID=3103948 RepID=UPI002B3E72A9|nr:RNA polymerase sigma-70 factor [Algoriphagus sp. D3-2-R+10]MEB2777411.1 RNA polymerase sigma-70 factor [Algoriphagus sp. D3-2-R+10]